MTSHRPAPGRSSVRPALELADVVRRYAPCLEGISSEQRRVLNAVAACRSAALGGHVETCTRCQHQRIAYNSCRNRHCPKCRHSACARWMDSRAQELLPVEYFHVVFTLPSTLNGLAIANPRLLYGALFEAASQTLLAVAANPKHLGAKIGFLAILHTWGQNLQLHPHLHCVVPGGGLCDNGDRWVGCRPGFFLPVRVLSRVFRGKFIALLRKAFLKGQLRGVTGAGSFEQLVNLAVGTDWVVYSKPPFGGPDQVLKYLSRYTHRIAISNRRLLSMDDQTVTFQWKSYADGGRSRTMTLRGDEFLRRFLLHVVPKGFMRIRHFGLLGNRFRAVNLERCRQLLGNREIAGNNAAPGLSRDFATEIPDLCPVCGQGRMVRTRIVEPERRLFFLFNRTDTS